MASWTDRDSTHLGADVIFTSPTAQALYDNVIATAEGAEGATRIVYGALNLSNDLTQGDIANNAIGQGEIKTTTDTQTLDTTSAGPSIRTTAAGSYGMGFETQHDNKDSVVKNFGAFVGRAKGTTDWITEAIGATTNTGLDSFITLTKEATSNASITKMRIRYFQSSPPYDLGDGECGLFVTLDVDSEGHIAGSAISHDPVWANNGPTDIRPDFINKATGKKYKRIRRPAVTRADVEAGRADMADYIAAQTEAIVEEVEITHAFKNADMDLYPHSWVTPPQGTICLLDPVNTFDLLMLHEAGEDVSDLIHKGYIQIGDEVQRKGPPGVVPVTFKWRNTK